MGAGMVIPAGRWVQAARWWMWPLAAMAALAGTGAARAQIGVTLRPTAAIAPASAGSAAHATDSQKISLAEVADMDPPTGPEAEKLGTIVVGTMGGDQTTLSIAQVRGALDQARVNWGRISLRGSVCRVSRVSAATPAPETESRPAPRAKPASNVPQSVDLDGGATVRGAVVSRLVDLYNVDPADLRLAFDAKDDEFLAQTTDDRRVDVQPATTASSMQTLLNVFIYEGDRLLQTHLVSTRALINRTALTARGPIARGEAISSERVDVGRQWMAPNAKPPVSPEVAFGQIATRAIGAGSMLTVADVASPVVCKRGDLVYVHVLAGSLTVKAKCRAQGQARDGELVQLQLDGSDRIFTARMAGPGRAVVDAYGSSSNADNPTSAAPTADARITRRVP
jgi:flagella basal body P-ring formation protein FlgA